MPKLFAIADLHLPGGSGKTMEKFDPEWINHDQKIEDCWKERVREEDLVLVAGDISWAMRLEEALPDLERISAWPGRKILIRGNHDYWWSSIGKLRRSLDPGTFALQNDCLYLDGMRICGTRGWISPGGENFTAEDEKIYLRELLRLELSLKAAVNLQGELIVVLHFPPFNEKGEASGFVELMQRYGVSRCIYGHLHGQSQEKAVIGLVQGISYHLVAADYVDFCPVEIISY